MSQNNVDPSENDNRVDPSEDGGTSAAGSTRGESADVDPSERGGGSKGGDSPQAKAGPPNPVQHSE